MPGLLAQAAPLVDALDRITTPLTAAELADAGRYLRFGYEEPPALEPRSPRGRLGTLYARMYAAARANDHEALLPVIAELDALEGELLEARTANASE